MTATDLIALLPFIILAAAVMVVMLTVSFYRHHGLTFLLTLGSLSAASIVLPIAARVAPRPLTPLLIIDHYALFFMGLIFGAALTVSVLAYDYFRQRGGQREELYLLLLLAVLGAMVLVASRHFAAFFLGLELLSVSLFALIAYPRRGRRCLEAGFKYLVLSSVASSFLLFGMALIYAELGTLAFASVGALLAAADELNMLYLVSGLALLVVGIGFKLSWVPFHLWTPDIYEGAPAPVTAFVATVSKGSVFALLLRYCFTGDVYGSVSLLWTLSLIAVACMLIGNLLALLANNVKRLLAYSSIAHLGYLLVALVAGAALAVEAATYYLVAYFVTTLGAFAIIAALSTAPGEREADDLDDYRGLFWRRPWLAGVFTLMLFSLAGIPLTAGFIGKFYIFIAGAEGTLWGLLIILIIGSAIGLYYYLRVVVTMAMPPSPGSAAASPLPLASGVVLLALTLLLVGLGVYPTPLLDLIRTTTLSLLL